jgi:myo-inositol 2-dehydrogenase/D-chiro-inositol 1-dehydrogenase
MIGAGFIAAYHLDGLRAAGGAQVRVLAGRTLDKAGALAARYDIPAVTTDWREVLAREDVDAVVISTPDDTHPEIALAAAAAGKHILLQKPMARSVPECQRIIAAAATAQVHLSVSFMHRHFEEVVAARQLLAEGAIGVPYAMRMRNATPGADWGAWFYSRARVGGGVVMQLGVHGIDLLRHLFGDIVALSASTSLMRTERTLADGSVVRPDNEDHAAAIYRFASGATATHEMSMSELAGCDRFTLEIYGARGTLWLRSLRGPLAVYAPAHFGTREWVVPALPNRLPGERQHRAFLDVVRGIAADDGSAADGLASIRVADAIYRAQASRHEEPVATAGEPA